MLEIRLQCEGQKIKTICILPSGSAKHSADLKCEERSKLLELHTRHAERHRNSSQDSEVLECVINQNVLTEFFLKDLDTKYDVASTASG